MLSGRSTLFAFAIWGWVPRMDRNVVYLWIAGAWFVFLVAVMGYLVLR
jgi:hypothetical protein